MGVLHLASSVLTLFFIAILAGKKKKSVSDRLLMAWFVVLFSNVFIFYLIHVDSAPSWVIEFLNSSVFLQGPLLYFYTSALTGILEKLKLRHILHLIPFLILYSLTLCFNMVHWEYMESFNTGLIVLKFISPLIYILISMKIITQHRNRIQNIYSSTHQMELKWLSSILWGSIILMIVGSSSLLLHYFTRIEIPQYGGLYLNILYSAGIIALGYFGFRQTSIFVPVHLQNDQKWPEQASTKTNSFKYQKSRLDKEFVTQAYQELLNHMESEKPFTDPNLTLFKLAGELETTENKLSQVINSQSGYNFFEFVNKYRVDMVISKMAGNELISSTLLGLALDSGFNSKASFNRAFKKFTGQTPSEYLKANT